LSLVYSVDEDGKDNTKNKDRMNKQEQRQNEVNCDKADLSSHSTRYTNNKATLFT